VGQPLRPLAQDLSDSFAGLGAFGVHRCLHALAQIV
jgi:hypothetical protein